MTGSIRAGADWGALLVAAVVFLATGIAATSAWAQADDLRLAGASPGERMAIEALCAPQRTATYRDMCITNQINGIVRMGRKPDLSVAPPAKRAEIDNACSVHDIPAERFACERRALAAAALPVRDEPGGSRLEQQADALVSHDAPAYVNRDPVIERASRPDVDHDESRNPGTPIAAVQGIPHRSSAHNDSPAMSNPWHGRTAMPAAAEGPALTPHDIFERAAPSVYVVKASDEYADRTEYSQGGAVAIDSRTLLTNCHVVYGHQNITLLQHGVTGRAVLVSADEASDRCIIRSQDMEVHPIVGVRRFADLKVGEPVFSLGAPMGAEQSFREGKVSAMHRFNQVEIVQNSARTWFGSSGGGLFDSRGNLVGITTAVDTSVTTRNFSIAAEEYW